MYQEIALLKFLLTKVNYEKYILYVNELNLEPESETLLKSIGEYYKEYPDKEEITVSELILFSHSHNPHIKKRKQYTDFFNQLDNPKLNTKIIAENFNSIMERYFASEILFKVSEALEQEQIGILDTIQQDLANFDKIKLKLTNQRVQYTDNDVVRLVRKQQDIPGIKWRIGSLTTHLGAIKGKTLGHVFARVDTGKTSFVLSEEAYWVTQIADDEVIIHFNNEEDGEKLMIRFYQAVLNCSKEDLCNKPVLAKKAFVACGGNKFKLYDDAIISIEDIDEILSSLKGKCKAIVVDQADKLHFIGAAKLGDVARLQMVYAKLRELSKKHDCHVLTVGQASVTAENKKWLLPSDLDSSKTLKPGEFDYIVGIGKIFTEYISGVEQLRYLHLCKNKLGTGQHAQLEVLFDPSRALYREPTYKELEVLYSGGTRPEQLGYANSCGDA
jgi:acid stress-induced BolA-like protein IbaG/YrbA